MKKNYSKSGLKTLLLTASLVLLTACSAGLKDGTYKDENGFVLTVSGKEVELNALIATGTGTVKGKTIEMDTSVLGFSSGTQTLTYQVKGKTIDVTDESGNVMRFEPIEEGETTASLGDLVKGAVETVLEVEDEANSSLEEESSSNKSSNSSKSSTNSSEQTSSSSQTKTESDRTEVSTSELVGTWENAKGDRWEITAEGLLIPTPANGDTSELHTMKFSDNKLREASNWIMGLVNEDGSQVKPFGMGFVFKPAGVSSKDIPDNSDTSRDRFFVSTNGGDTLFNELPDWIFYKVDDTRATAESTDDSAVSLADFAGTWKSEKFGTLIIDKQGRATAEDGTAKYDIYELKDSNQPAFEAWPLNSDGSKKLTGGAATYFLPAGSIKYQPKSDSTKDRLYFSQATADYELDVAEIYYRVESKATNTSKKKSSSSEISSSKAVWNDSKAKQLAQFMVDWGKQMGQPDYQEMAGKYALVWKGNTDEMMDVTYNQSGSSSSDYTVVAVYDHPLDGFSAHRYFFAIKLDGSPVVLYSNNGRSYGPVSFSLPDGYEPFVINVIGETDNQVLKEAFNALVKGKELPDLSQLNPNPRWDDSKASQLAQFMVNWGKQMGQPGYVDIYKQRAGLIWNGSRLDVTYHTNGISNSDYTIVAAYAYDRGGGLYHRYHFAILADGSTSILYSEGGSGTGNTYELSKLNTANTDLQNGFASIVNP